MRIAIIGAYGNVGKSLAQHLAKISGLSLVLMGRNQTKLNALAQTLALSAASLETRTVDAGDEASLVAALGSIDLVVLTTSKTTHAKTVARAALTCGVDYIDTLLSSHEKQAALQTLENDIRNKQRVFITDGGYHPGLVSAMARHAMAKTDALTDIVVAGSFNLDWSRLDYGIETMEDFIGEIASGNAAFFRDGKWENDPTAYTSFTFDKPAGKRFCVPMGLLEINELVRVTPALRTFGFYIAGFGFMVDYLIFPLCFSLIKLFPNNRRLAARALLFGLNHFTKGPTWAQMRLEGRGTHQGKDVSVLMKLDYPDPLELTVFPVLALIDQYIAGDRRPGLWMQALYLDPEKWVQKMQSLGVTIQLTHSV